MLYIDFAKNREDFILDDEEKFPKCLKDFLYFFRKMTGQVIEYELDGKNIVLISRLNKRTFRKLEKIFNVDVTKNVCACDTLIENKKFLNLIEEKNLQLMDGRWLFKYLICEISEYICRKLDLKPESQEISLLVDEPNSLIFDTIKNLSSNFKNINIVTNKIRKFDRISEEIYEENGLVLNVTNNFKKACLNSKIVFNVDFDEKSFGKITFLSTSVIINLEKNIEVKQSNFIGKNIDFYSVNLPLKYKKVYDRLNKFNSSKLYESFIYKKTLNQNIWSEIKKDRVEVIVLEGNNKILNFTN